MMTVILTLPGDLPDTLIKSSRRFCSSSLSPGLCLASACLSEWKIAGATSSWTQAGHLVPGIQATQGTTDSQGTGANELQLAYKAILLSFKKMFCLGFLSWSCWE